MIDNILMETPVGDGEKVPPFKALSGETSLAFIIYG